MTDVEKLKKLQRKPTRQCSHATSFVTTINTSIFDSSTAFEELEIIAIVFRWIYKT